MEEVALHDRRGARSALALERPELQVLGISTTFSYAEARAKNLHPNLAVLPVLASRSQALVKSLPAQEISEVIDLVVQHVQFTRQPLDFRSRAPVHVEV